MYLLYDHGSVSYYRYYFSQLVLPHIAYQIGVIPTVKPGQICCVWASIRNISFYKCD